MAMVPTPAGVTPRRDRHRIVPEQRIFSGANQPGRG
ncbi:hypothetical protein BH10PSE9_BH10PSE9_11650 [soil metagenome]